MELFIKSIIVVLQTKSICCSKNETGVSIAKISWCSPERWRMLKPYRYYTLYNDTQIDIILGLVWDICISRSSFHNHVQLSMFYHPVHFVSSLDQRWPVRVRRLSVRGQRDKTIPDKHGWKRNDPLRSVDYLDRNHRRNGTSGRMFGNLRSVSEMLLVQLPLRHDQMRTVLCSNAVRDPAKLFQLLGEIR